LLNLFLKNGGWKKYRQNSTGKKFLTTDFRPEHLRIIYDVFNNAIVKDFLENKISARPLKLFNQFQKND